jgi:hypothetical protein
MGRRPLPKRIAPFIIRPLTLMISWGISSPFELLSLALGQVTNALLTRSPLRTITSSPFDLHVLSTPPAFILSQDQTLHQSLSSCDVVIFFTFLPYFTGISRFPITLQLLRSEFLTHSTRFLSFRDQTPMSSHGHRLSDRQVFNFGL